LTIKINHISMDHGLDVMLTGWVAFGVSIGRNFQ
jgi:hypothetical protein